MFTVLLVITFFISVQDDNVLENYLSKSSEAYLQPFRTSMMKRFWESSKRF